MLALAFALASQSLVAPISLTVDARDIARGLYHVTERFLASPGPLVLEYPQWMPGAHMGIGQLGSVVEFRILADGKPLEWKRDLVDMYRVSAGVPEGTKQVAVDFTVADSSGSGRFARVSWFGLVWYPPLPSNEVRLQASLLLPPQWKAASALPVEREGGDSVVYKPTTLTRLVDSPAEIGRYYRQFDVTGSSPVKHYFDVMGDSEAAINPSPAILDHVRRIHEEMEAITGTRHYRDYHWLFTLSDHGGFNGLEHHESSEDGLGSDAFGAGAVNLGDLLCHEYFHSYNGKFRRPAGLCTLDYQAPMQDDLLWVYEGLTQFMGQLLACRTGFWTDAQWREQMALNYEEMNTTGGRRWRPLEDTAAGVPGQITSFQRGPSWASARRGSDYYVESTLLWLEVDMRIRQLTDGRESIMDFIRLFHGGPPNGPELKPYVLADVVAALNQVAPYDWGGLFRKRVYELQPTLSEDGFKLAGWRMEYNDTPNVMEGLVESRASLRLTTSLGIVVGVDGTINDVVPDSPADKAGLCPSMKLVAVNGEAYSATALKAAIGARVAGKPIELITNYKDIVRALRIDYQGGMRYPHLVRVPGSTDRLKDLLTPLVK